MNRDNDAERSIVVRATLLAMVMALAMGAGSASAALPDGRGWELVSPVDKNGGTVSSAAEAGAGTLRAAAQGGAIAFASKASFAGGAGAAPFSQYVATRASSGWTTQNITPAHLSGAYDGAPYVAFSDDLARSLYRNPGRCPVGDPCPAGYQLRDGASGALVASPVDPGLFEGASPSLGHVVFSKAGELRLWTPPGGIAPLGVPAGSSLAAAQGAIAANGQRIYFAGPDDNLYLREGGTTAQVDTATGGGGSFEAASADGSVAFFSKAGHLYRYAGGSAIDLAPAGGVDALLAADASGSTAYYRVANSIWRWRQGTGATQILTAFPSSALNDTSPRTAGTTADGSRLFFTTAARFPLSDVNLAPDVYQWQPSGSGSCLKAPGCVDLISAGLAGSSTFAGTSADGSDVFFTTDRSLVAGDPEGSIDLYDARIGGGFPEPVAAPLCVGDACQGIPVAPEDPVLTTTLAGPGNPPERYVKYGRRCAKGKRAVSVKRKGKRVTKCVAKKGRAKKGRAKKGRGAARGGRR